MPYNTIDWRFLVVLVALFFSLAALFFLFLHSKSKTKRVAWQGNILIALALLITALPHAVFSITLGWFNILYLASVWVILILGDLKFQSKLAFALSIIGGVLMSFPGSALIGLDRRNLTLIVESYGVGDWRIKVIWLLYFLVPTLLVWYVLAGRAGREAKFTSRRACSNGRGG